MRIAFFHNIPSGGAKRSHYEQIKILSKSHNIDLYTITGIDDEFLPLRDFVRQRFEFALEYINFPKPLFFLSPLAVLLNLFRYERLSKRIAGKIDEGNYEIVFVARDYGVSAPSILRYVKTPAVYYCQEPPRDLYESQALAKIGPRFSISRFLRVLNFLPYRHIYKKIDKRNTKCARKVLVNSRFSKKIVDGIYGIDTEVVYHGVDTEKFKPGLAAKENMVIAVGALHWRKGYGFIIESLSRLKDKPKLIIVADRGGRAEEEYLLDLAAKGNVDIKIYKNINLDEELIGLYDKAKLCVCAPFAEPLGLVPLEAMSCAIPVVAVNEGGLVETVINGETGILTERDLGQFSQAISALINDDELRNRYAQKAREYVIRKWQWNAPVNQLEGILSSCCSVNPQCNICKTQESELIFNKEGYEYFICKKCGLVYIYPRPSYKELVNIYEELSKEYFTVEFKIKEDFSQGYQDILNSLEEYKLTGRLLEIGCSTGSMLIAAQKKGWLPFGTEISEQSASYGIKRHQLNIFIGELCDAHFPGDYFDTVLLIQTLEHLGDPDGYIKECQRILRKGGALFISVPNFKGITLSLLKKRYFYVSSQHLFYFSPKSIKTLLSKRGFRITRLNTQGLDLFNMVLGRVFDLNRKMEVQRTFLRTSSALRKNKFFLPVRFIYKLLTFPLCYLGRGDGILLYAEKK